MVNKQFGYARVSSTDQNEGRQTEALTSAGIEERFIFLDKTSGRDFNRPQYQLLLKALREGDTVVIKSIDRLGRNYSEITEQWRVITKEIKAHIKVLDLPLLDTTVNNKDLTGMFIADLVLNILSYVAQQEREFIRQRQAEGIAAAQARGVKFGRQPMERPTIFPEVKEIWERGEISAREAGRRLGINYKTFQAWARE